jgi:alpha-L-fucosidase 2
MHRIMKGAGALIILTAGLAGTPPAPVANRLALWYLRPAAAWEEALPVGNGRLGAMVFGDPVRERLQLNEESLWAGSPINNNNRGALDHLPGLRRALFEGRFGEAETLAREHFLGTPPRIRSYQPLGDLRIDYAWKAPPENYRRELDLTAGIVSAEFTVAGKIFRQEVFVSAPDDILVGRIAALDGGTVDAVIGLARERDAVVAATPSGRLLLRGQIQDAEDPLCGPGGAHMKFAGELRLTAEAGTLTAADGALRVEGARSVEWRFGAATDYAPAKLDFDRSLDPARLASGPLDRAAGRSFRDLRRRHLAEYRPMFERVRLDLGGGELASLPTDERLRRMKEGGEDHDLLALYFQFGRYLLMGSSRGPAVLPANLQGIWNKDLQAAWNSDFHTNINLQMNYWPAEVANLAETVRPLTGFLERLTGPGAFTAREMYGTAGWTLHHLTDPFGRTGVADGVWGITPLNGPWMTFAVFEHYLFSGDTEFLRRRAWPLMKGAAEFVLGFLTESPEGYWVTSPSHSPENAFFAPGTGEKASLTYAATVDIEIVNALFDQCREASRILGIDREFAARLEAAQKRLPPVRTNRNGAIQEWIADYEEVEPGHRHMSHLLGLYPLDQFTPETPGLFRAARATIERRLSFGGGHTGWSRAWIVNLYARLQDGAKSYENLLGLLRKSTLANLFDTHPPFQIDGNFGGTAGIAEMLLQSHGGLIRLLPALPPAWSRGRVRGLRARGGLVVDISWEKGRLVRAELRPTKSGRFRVAYGGEVRTVAARPGAVIVFRPGAR